MTAVSVPLGAFYGFFSGNKYLSGLWRPGLVVTFAALSVSIACLLYAFVTDDFSVAYVASHSNTKLDLLYKVAALWGSHEGSMMLWIWIITAWGVAALLSVRTATESMARNQAIVLGIVGMLCVFLLLTSSPFERILPLVPTEGKDLNPILQDIGMILHPPLLFLGYAGLTFCFGTALGILLTGSLDRQKQNQLTVFTTVTWLFLTAGNMLGSWWAYKELGWGGWWFWDPVENASFIPWLMVTAQLHALLLVRYRRHLQKSAVLLCIGSFVMCLLGTFIVRSGVMQSVHAFASDPNRGIFLLVISLLILVPGFIVYCLRANQLTDEKDRQLQVEDLGLALAVMLLAAAAACVLFGTIYPMVYESLKGGSISVGAPYFNSIFAPLTILAAVLIGCTQLAKSKWEVWLISMLFALIPAVFFALMTDCKDPVMTAGGIFGAVWIVSSFLFGLLIKRKRFNMFAVMAHVGVAVCMIGAVGDSQYQQEALVRMGPGNGRPLGDLIFVYDKTNKVDTNSYFADEGEVLVLDKDENELMTLRPQRQTFKSNGMEMTHAGISHGILRDLYVSMGNQLSPTEYLVRLNIKPLISWLWMGGLLMMLGGAAALFRRRRD